MRQDMLKITDQQWLEIRNQILRRDCSSPLIIDKTPVNIWASVNLSEVRIFDIIGWRL
jgi:hypothetical protein